MTLRWREETRFYRAKGWSPDPGTASHWRIASIPMTAWDLPSMNLLLTGNRRLRCSSISLGNWSLTLKSIPLSPQLLLLEVFRLHHDGPVVAVVQSFPSKAMHPVEGDVFYGLYGHLWVFLYLLWCRRIPACHIYSKLGCRGWSLSSAYSWLWSLLPPQ